MMQRVESPELKIMYLEKYAVNIGAAGIANLLLCISSLILLPIITKISAIVRDMGVKERCL